MNNNTTQTVGIGLGNVIACIVSFTKWHSILWALVHGWLGWFYLIYYFFTYM
jgi:hypothetical protein